eukprot:gene25453-8600_t
MLRSTGALKGTGAPLVERELAATVGRCMTYRDTHHRGQAEAAAAAGRSAGRAAGYGHSYGYGAFVAAVPATRRDVSPGSSAGGAAHAITVTVTDGESGPWHLPPDGADGDASVCTMGTMGSAPASP